MNNPFSPPYNWCDRRCERCPLANECDVYRRSQAIRQRCWLQGDDPDELSTAMREVNRSLLEALALAYQIAIEEGYSPDELPDEAPPPSPAAIALQQVVFDYANAVQRLLSALPDGASARALAEDALASALVVCTKVARCSSPILDLDLDDEIWELDVVPNLLAIEHLDAQIAEAVRAVGVTAERAEFDAIRAALLRALEGRFARIPPARRLDLARLIALGRAPSPFCKVPSR